MRFGLRVWGVAIVALAGLVWAGTNYAWPMAIVLTAGQLAMLWVARSTPSREGGWFAWVLFAELAAVLFWVIDLPDSRRLPWFSFEYLVVLIVVVSSSLLIWLWPRGRSVRSFAVGLLAVIAVGVVAFLVRENCDFSRNRSWCDAAFVLEDNARDAFVMPGRVFDVSHLGVNESGPAVIRTFVDDVTDFPEVVVTPSGLSAWESTELRRREAQHYEAETANGCAVDLIVYEANGRSESEARLLVNCR